MKLHSQEHRYINTDKNKGIYNAWRYKFEILWKDHLYRILLEKNQ